MSGVIPSSPFTYPACRVIMRQPFQIEHVGRVRQNTPFDERPFLVGATRGLLNFLSLASGFGSPPASALG